MKKSLSWLLIASMALSLLSGCAAGGGASPTPSPTAAPTAAASPEAPVDAAAPAEERISYSPDVVYTVGDENAPSPVGGEASADFELTGELAGELLPQPTAEAPEEPLPDAEASVSGGFLFDPEAAAGFSGGGEAASAQAVRQLTIEDIQAMNPGSTVVDIYSNRGFLSLLLGRYYDGKVEDVEDGIASIQGMASLLGLSKGSEFFAVSKTRHNSGYTFYTYQQRYGDTTLRYATLRIVVDPAGYTAGLACSFVPNAGTASQDPAISAERAEAIIKNRYRSQALTYFPGTTVRLAAPFNNRVYNCWVVYTSNPDATASFDMPYLEHFVTTDGQYVTSIPASGFARSNADVMDNSRYFLGLETERCRKTLTLEDGSAREIDVPVSYNPNDGKYYLMDPERKIAVADYYDFNYADTVTFVTSDTPDGWTQNNLLAYANYIILYDFYADHGIRSVDGFGTPILITVGWCDENRNPVDNACFYGVITGWACFGVSDANHYSDAVDVVGHEYTHGVTRQSRQGNYYRNETGAIDEAFSDIMGNLVEMSLNYTDDRGWLVGEKTGAALRDMSDPNRFLQPAFVGDQYYKSSVLVPVSGVNDNGGVHDNNSLLGHIAWRMNEAGMSYEDQISMWLVANEILTPLSDYSDVHAALLMSLKILGLLEKHGPALNRAFEAAGLNDDWNESYLHAVKDGCGRVTFEADETLAEQACAVVLLTADGKLADMAYPGADGAASALLPAGQYMASLIRQTEEGGLDVSYYSGSDWSKTRQVLFTVAAGQEKVMMTRVGSGGKDYSPVTLAPFDGGYFSILVPEGWEMEINGRYTGFSFKFYDPADPATQVFYFGNMAPYHKSEMARRYWAATNAVIGQGPVLSTPDILGVLNCWDEAIALQETYDGQALFTPLSDMTLLGGSYYNTNYYSALQNTESGCVIRCAAMGEDDCLLTILCALVDEDMLNRFGGNCFYNCRNLYGILAPADRYDEVFDTLQECLKSLRFTPEYIRSSWGANDPMADQATITRNTQILADVLRALYDTYGK